ncbi:hypothetical protein [Pontivivens ytuae]|uniref:Uncharacterized protein n=1 Tax=Pontivivens ytuae TaxID=2789856 RepID=A0A7S9QC20_9RHOB|nr:hypothetical protein [Pontivivens ytuae]QPH53468.1 hypothetical protein I0K15_17025 [Pontivivens ytuae]
MRAFLLLAALPLAAQAQTVPPDEWTAAVNGNTAVYFDEGRVVRREYWLGSVFGFSLRMQDHTGECYDGIALVENEMVCIAWPARDGEVCQVSEQGEHGLFTVHSYNFVGDPLDTPPLQMEIVPGDVACGMEQVG